MPCMHLVSPTQSSLDLVFTGFAVQALSNYSLIGYASNWCTNAIRVRAESFHFVLVFFTSAEVCIDGQNASAVLYRLPRTEYLSIKP